MGGGKTALNRRNLMQKVSVGITSAVGYALTLTGFTAAIVAYLTGDHSADNVNVIVSGAIATLAYVVTSIGRYLQAQALIKNPPRQTGGAIANTMPPDGMTFPTSSTAIAGVLASADEPDELEPPDELDPRADAVPITDRPPADVGDAGDPADTVPAAKAARA